MDNFSNGLIKLLTRITTSFPDMWNNYLPTFSKVFLIITIVPALLLLFKTLYCGGLKIFLKLGWSRRAYHNTGYAILAAFFAGLLIYSLVLPLLNEFLGVVIVLLGLGLATGGPFAIIASNKNKDCSLNREDYFDNSEKDPGCNLFCYFKATLLLLVGVGLIIFGGIVYSL